ncbi:MAG: hypothetical protein Q9187_003417 [Circinaria calcarea]
MAQPSIPVPLFEALKLRTIGQGNYVFTLPGSFCFGSRIFGGLLISFVHLAAREYFTTTHSKQGQPDVLSMQLQFFRLTFPSEASISIEDIHLGKSTSTIQVTVSQGGKKCLVGYLNMTNLQASKGISFETSWTLTPAPIEASILMLAADIDPRWISYQTPYHPESFRRVQSYLKFFIPYEPGDLTSVDQWVTPSDPQTTFTNENIGFVADLSLPILDNFYPKEATGCHAAIVAAGLLQKKDRENDIIRVPDVSSGSYETPAMIITLATNIEIKKRLPICGVKWLFMRAQAKQIKNGRMDMEVVILDEKMDLVALSSQVLSIVDLKRVKKTKPTL